ncbi:MAG TPA: peptidoglycan-binding domain-containing protein [Polyangia bacterium]|nr:peptidoglycan-binding domain-containing protein [Polyangia bacterium]
MRRTIALTAVLLAGCHAHHVANDRQTMKSPPKQEEVSSARPVRTTPGGMLDPQSMRKLQAALARHGESVEQSGQLDDATQAALRKFQRKQHQPATGLPDYDTLRRLGLDPKDIYLGGTHRREAARKTSDR